MSSAFINNHMTRVLAAGVDDTTINKTWLDDVDEWLNDEGELQNLIHLTMPDFGVVRNGSEHISTIFDIGTTWLPAGGDYTPVTPASTTYSATGLNGTAPAWVNANSSAHGYYGLARNGTMRFNNIRRLHHLGITFVAAYQKSHTNLVTLLAIGEQGGFSLQNLSDANGGKARFNVGGWGNAWTLTVDSASTLANNTAHILYGTFDGTTARLYVEGIADGSPQSLGAPSDTNKNPLLGGVGSTTANYFLGSGSQICKVQLAAQSIGLTRVFSNNQAQYTGGCLGVFQGVWSPTKCASFNALLRGHIGA